MCCRNMGSGMIGMWCAGGTRTGAASNAAPAQEANLCAEVVHGGGGVHEGGVRERL